MEYPQRLEIKHVLCPIDFSPISDMALRYAAVAARQFGARLTVLHAERFESPRYLTRETKAQLADEIKRAKAYAVVELRHHAEALLGSAIPPREVHYTVEAAEPAAAVLRWGREAGVDLVVMGTHGLSGFKRVMMGSVAEAVVRQSKAPVFTVRPRTHAFIDGQRPDADPAIDVILCPLIPEAAFLGPLHYAAALAERFGAVLKVLQVVESGDPLDQVGTRLREVAAEAVGQRCPWSVEARPGRAAEQIVSLAENQAVDMLVIGARHRPFADVAILGRTTELVLRHASVPVLAVPLPDED